MIFHHFFYIGWFDLTFDAYQGIAVAGGEDYHFADHVFFDTYHDLCATAFFVGGDHCLEVGVFQFLDRFFETLFYIAVTTAELEDFDAVYALF